MDYENLLREFYSSLQKEYNQSNERKNKTKIISETSISKFNSWSGAKNTQDRIVKEGKENEFDAMIEELYPDGLTDTELNDMLWFEEEWIYETLGITDDEEEKE